MPFELPNHIVELESFVGHDKGALSMNGLESLAW